MVVPSTATSAVSDAPPSEMLGRKVAVRSAFHRGWPTTIAAAT